MRRYSLLGLYVSLMTMALPMAGRADVLDLADDMGAFGGGTIGDLLCKVVYWFTGTVGQGIASLAVVVLGVGAAMGKVSYGMALTTMVGISVIFGAQDIVYELTDQMPCYGDLDAFIAIISAIG